MTTPDKGLVTAAQVRTCFVATSTTQNDDEWWGVCTANLNAALAPLIEREVARERDEAIVGAYRAAAEHEPIMGDDSPHGDAWIQCSCGWSPDSSLTWTAHILALTHTPESGD